MNSNGQITIAVVNSDGELIGSLDTGDCTRCIVLWIAAIKHWRRVFSALYFFQLQPLFAPKVPDLYLFGPQGFALVLCAIYFLIYCFNLLPYKAARLEFGWWMVQKKPIIGC